MKKNLICLFAFICSMTLFTACGDDENDNNGNGGNGGNNTPNIAAEVAGNYTGTLYVSINNMQVAEMPDQPVAVTQAADEETSSINVTISDFKFGQPGQQLEMGDVALENCNLTEENGNYTCARTEVLDLNQPVGSCNTDEEITFKGDSLIVNLSLDVTLLGQKVDVTYKGEKD